MNVSLVYADPKAPLWIELELDEGSTVADALGHADTQKRLAAIDISSLRIGVFGRLAPPTQPLKAGDRVEIYCPIVVDPKQVKRRDRTE